MTSEAYEEPQLTIEHVKIADAFSARLEELGGQNAVAQFNKYIAESFLDKKAPIPREYIFYGDGEERKSEADLFAEVVSDVQEDLKAAQMHRRTLLKHFALGVGLSVGVGFLLPKIALDIMMPLPANPNPQQLARRKKEELAATVGTIFLSTYVLGSLTAVGLLSTVSMPEAWERINNDVGMKLFAGQVDNIRQEMNNTQLSRH